MSDTPRTDKAIEEIIIGDHEGSSETDGPWVNVLLARQLETELNECLDAMIERHDQGTSKMMEARRDGGK